MLLHAVLPERWLGLFLLLVYCKFPKLWEALDSMPNYYLLASDSKWTNDNCDTTDLKLLLLCTGYQLFQRSIKPKHLFRLTW